MSVLRDVLKAGDTVARVTVVLSSATIRSISDSHGFSVAFELCTPGWGPRQIVVDGDEIIEVEWNENNACERKLSELVIDRNRDLELEVAELRNTIHGLNDADMSLEGQVKDLQAKLKDVTAERDELLAEMAKSPDQEDLVEAAAAIGMDAEDRLMPEEIFDEVPSAPSASPTQCDECSSTICADGECHGCYARLRTAVGTMVSVAAAASAPDAATWLMAVLLGKQDEDYPETAQIQVDELHEIVKNACYI